MTGSSAGGPAGGTLVLLRHGQSTANASQTFTGLLDVDLTERGEDQARRAAQLLAAGSLDPEVVITSPMLRAARTATLVLEEGGWTDLPVRRTWRLAERDYGALTWVSKSEARSLHGPEEYIAVRRTLDGSPGPATPDQARTWPPAYTAPGTGLPEPGAGETLRDVVERVRPVWDEVRSAVRAGATVLVVAHGNSLRALCLLVDRLSAEEVQGLNLPPGQPLVYGARPTGEMRPRGGRYLDAVEAAAAADRIAHEGGT